MVTTQVNKSEYFNFSQIHHYLPKLFPTTPLSRPPRGGEMGRSDLFFLSISHHNQKEICCARLKLWILNIEYAE